MAAETKTGTKPQKKERRPARNHLAKSIHSAASDLFEIGVIDSEAMRLFDEACLVPETELTPADILQIRKHANVSQPIFAQRLGTSRSTVQKWESGAKSPSGPAQKLLRIVQKHGMEILG